MAASRNKSARRKAALKAKHRRRAARRYGLLTKKRPGGRLTGRLKGIH